MHNLPSSCHTSQDIDTLKSRTTEDDDPNYPHESIHSCKLKLLTYVMAIRGWTKQVSTNQPISRSCGNVVSRPCKRLNAETEVVDGSLASTVARTTNRETKCPAKGSHMLQMSQKEPFWCPVPLKDCRRNHTRAGPGHSLFRSSGIGRASMDRHITTSGTPSDFQDGHWSRCHCHIRAGLQDPQQCCSQTTHSLSVWPNSLSPQDCGSVQEGAHERPEVLNRDNIRCAEPENQPAEIVSYHLPWEMSITSGWRTEHSCILCTHPGTCQYMYCRLGLISTCACHFGWQGNTCMCLITSMCLNIQLRTYPLWDRFFLLLSPTLTNGYRSSWLRQRNLHLQKCHPRQYL